MIEKSYYIETYGCQMNEHDSEKMSAMLGDMGLKRVESAELADVVVINTCAIRAKAEHKVYSALGTLRIIKSEKPELVTIVSGCVAQQEKEKLFKRAGHVDIVLGTHHIAELPAALQDVWRDRKRRTLTEWSSDVESLHTPAPVKNSSSVSSFLNIMQGCSNFCAYCVVPYARGPEQSRSMEEVLAEAQRLTAHGVKDITLLGQNVNAFGKDLATGKTFADLLEELNKITGLERLRFTTSHPRDFNEGLASAMARLSRVCEHIHLPLQSGSDSVLKRMRRGYTIGDYLKNIEVLRNKIPHVAITSDIIVGFPGESDTDFAETMKVLATIRFDQIFSFKYSPRPQTAALKLEGHLPEDIKRARLADVHKLQEAITRDYHSAAVGTVQEVLIEKTRNSCGQATGRTRTNKIVNINSSREFQPGSLVGVKIIRGLRHSLIGEI